MSGRQDITGCDASRTENQDNVVENENIDLSLDKVSTDENSPVLTQEIETTDTDNQNQEETNFYGMREQGDIRLVLLGRTGSGKSATGNTILAKKEFLSKASGSSITGQCQLAENRSAGHRLLVVDTPGLFDTKLSQGETTREIIRCINMSTPGPHAFLLVLRLDRFTKEEIDTFSTLFDLFGEQMSSYAIIVFTRLDDLEVESRSIEEFNSSDEDLKLFISKVDGKYIAFNNRGTDEQKKQQVANLTKKLVEMIKNNGGKHYTNKMYEEAETELQKKIAEVERIKTLERKREVEQIESKFKDKMSEIEDSNQKLEKEIEKQMENNANIQSEKEKSEEMIHNIQLELRQINEDHQKELFEVKQEAKRMEEIKMRELNIREEENKRLIREMKQKHEEAEKRMQILENQRQAAVNEQINRFQSLIEQNIKNMMKQLHTTQMESLLNDSRQKTQSALEKNNELKTALKETKLKMLQNEERERTYREHVAEDLQKLQRDILSEQQHRNQLQTQLNNRGSGGGCLIM